MRVYQYKTGTLIEFSARLSGSRLCKLDTKKRGEITEFSSRSAARLRRLLCRMDFESVYSITLTLPKCDLQSNFRELWHDFVVRYRASFPNVTLIWRIELQQRGVPHWHLIAVTNNYLLCWDIKSLWQDVVKRWQPQIITAPFYLHGVKISSYTLTSAKTINYFCSHLSKHKQSQLGWRGRQWGVLNYNCVRFSDYASFEVDNETSKKITRQLRRLNDRLTAEGKYSNLFGRNGLRSSLFGVNHDRFMKCLKCFGAKPLSIIERSGGNR